MQPKSGLVSAFQEILLDDTRVRTEMFRCLIYLQHQR
jgi:hypothetical protein